MLFVGEDIILPLKLVGVDAGGYRIGPTELITPIVEKQIASSVWKIASKKSAEISADFDIVHC